MGDYFNENTKDLSALTERFDSWEFSFFKTRESGQSLIAFCCQTDSISNFENDWFSISNFVAAEYISKLESSFEKWNAYLVYVCTENISKEIQYKIENNKFSTRKVVVNQQNRILNSGEIKNLINRIILSSNIRIDALEFNTSNELKVSDLANRLFLEIKNVDNNQPARDARKAWLADELARVDTNEN